MSALNAVLLEKLSVKAIDNGQFSITVVLPADMVRDYCRLLESLAGFFQVVNRKMTAAAAELRAAQRQSDHQAQKIIAEYDSRIVSAYDAYRRSGFTREETIKKIAADLRAECHPWRSPDLVRFALASAGRVGQRGRPAKAAHASLR